MATASTHLLARRLRHLASGPAADSELLERFALCRDEAAFEALLRRHGSMVLGVCRRLLGDRHAAEDCFQAVFVVLARQAGSLRQPEALAAWLYGVALRTARKARAQEARRRVCERRCARPLAAKPPEEFLWRDLRSVLDEAVALLPEKYRLPFLLHHLEGLTVAQAARQLGCPVGTVAARLARARDQLRRRLMRRGLVLSAGALTAALADNVALARVAPPLLASTLTAATSVAVVPAEITTLVQGVLKTMTLTRLKAAVAVMLVLALLSGSAAWLARPLPAAPPNTAQTTPKGKQPMPDRQRLQGEWAVVSEVQNGKDVTGAGCEALVIAGDVLTFRGKTESGAAVFDLCPLTRAKRIDVVFPNKGWTLLGAYRLEGNLLTLCLAAPGTRRPGAFESRDGSHLVLYVLKRRSPGVRQTRTGSQVPSIGFTSDFGITGSIVVNERNFDTFFFPMSFVDSGTVPAPGNNARFTGGFQGTRGLQLRAPGRGPVPLTFDFGFPIVKGDKERQQVFSFWVGFFR